MPVVKTFQHAAEVPKKKGFQNSNLQVVPGAARKLLHEGKEKEVCRLE